MRRLRFEAIALGSQASQVVLRTMSDASNGRFRDKSRIAPSHTVRGLQCDGFQPSPIRNVLSLSNRLAMFAIRCSCSTTLRRSVRDGGLDPPSRGHHVVEYIRLTGLALLVLFALPRLRRHVASGSRASGRSNRPRVSTVSPNTCSRRRPSAAPGYRMRVTRHCRSLDSRPACGVAGGHDTIAAARWGSMACMRSRGQY